MIYFMQPVSGGPVKIGTSANPELRRLQLEARYGEELAVLATMPGGREEERAWHDRFAYLRFGRTEQFRPAAELMGAIGRPLLVGANPDAVEAMEPCDYRLGPETLADLDRISDHYRLGSRAAAIRLAARTLVDILESRTPQATRKRSR